MKERSCDACSACCIALRIDAKPGFSTRLDTNEDISKPAGEPCRYLKQNKCSIYEVRPLVCRRFLCDWRQYRKGFSDNDAPIKIGYLSARGSKFYIP